MNPLILGSIFDIGSKILDKVFPDPQQKAEAQLKLIELQQSGQLAELNHELAKLNIDRDISLGQVEINKIEASSDNLYKSGWRPGAGWVCVAGLTYEFLIRPLTPLFCSLFAVTCPELISLDQVLWELMFGMLGLGTMRTFEKKKIGNK